MFREAFFRLSQTVIRVVELREGAGRKEELVGKSAGRGIEVSRNQVSTSTGDHKGHIVCSVVLLSLQSLELTFKAGLLK